MKPKYRIANQDHEVSPVTRGKLIRLDINGRTVAVENNDKTGTKQILTINGRNYEVYVAQQGSNIFVQLDGEHWQAEAINPIDAAGGSGVSSDVIVAPMPGTVVSLKSSPGDVVTEGTILLTIESMKLQTAIIAERAGRISTVNFGEGDTFDKGAELIRFEAQDDEKEK